MFHPDPRDIASAQASGVRPHLRRKNVVVARRFRTLDHAPAHRPTRNTEPAHRPVEQILQPPARVSQLGPDLTGWQVAQHPMGHAVRPDREERGIQAAPFELAGEIAPADEIRGDEKERRHAALR